MKKEITTTKLLKYLKGELSQSEAAEVEQWSSQSPDNEKTLVSLAKVYNLGQLARPYTAKEVEDAWKKTCGKAGVAPYPKRASKVYRPWLFWGMAAAIWCCCLSIWPSYIEECTRKKKARLSLPHSRASL